MNKIDVMKESWVMGLLGYLSLHSHLLRIGQRSSSSSSPATITPKIRLALFPKLQKRPSIYIRPKKHLATQRSREEDAKTRVASATCKGMQEKWPMNGFSARNLHAIKHRRVSTPGGVFRKITRINSRVAAVPVVAAE
jgi:hypothetical protein